MAVTTNQASQMLREAVQSSIQKRARLYLAEGVILAAAGAAAILAAPGIAGWGAVRVLAWLLIVSGAVQTVSLIGAREAPSFWLQLITVALHILVGVLLLTNPIDQGAITLLLLVLLMVSGMERIVFSLMIRPMPTWGWVLGSGLVAIACSLILFNELPEARTWTLGALLGVHLLTAGLSDVWLARRARRAR